MNLCLGTVQFGMDYGIKGQKRPTLDQSIEMLDYATQNGITHLDTAYAYGSAEDVLGCFIRKKTVPRDSLFISAKLCPNILDELSKNQYYTAIRKNLEESLRRIGTDYLDAYMCHSSRYVYNDDILGAMKCLKEDGLVKHVGVSVYEVEEARRCLSSEYTDFMQLPFSILDQRMFSTGVLDDYIDGETQIDARSAFIQGLITMQCDQIPNFLAKARPIMQKVDSLCKRYNVKPVELAIGFVKNCRDISHLVFGVDNMAQLKEDIRIFNGSSLSSDILIDIGKEFRDISADIVMPSLWKKN